MFHEALATGIARGFVVAAGIVALALVITIVMVTLRKEDIAATPAMPGLAGEENAGQPELEDAVAR